MIWLSSLSLSNDSMEGKLIAALFNQIAETDGLAQAHTHRLQGLVSFLEKIIDGLGFCLSEDGDLLSQWRGYAADASGVSIGFSKEYLEKFGENREQAEMGFTLQKVEYDPETQEGLVKPTYMKVKQLIDQGAFKIFGRRSLLDMRNDDEIEKEDGEIKSAFSRLSMTILPLFAELYLLKTWAFREEREWRLISYFLKNGDETCSFRAVSDRIIPFRKFELAASVGNPIVEVILGPKNITPEYVIESFLKQNGFGAVKISRSKATYR